MYKSLICLVTLAYVSTETNAIKLTEKSDPICSSAGCGQYKHPKKDRGYDIDYPVAKDMMILSVGTGVDNKSYTFEQSKDWGKAQWMVPLINVLISANAETTDHYLRQIFNTTEEPSSYMRVNIDLEADKSKMDDTDSDYLNYLREKGHEMFKLNQKELESFIKRLL